MPVYVALLRAINVGTGRTIRMTDLVKMFESAGCTDVETYIQSGNVVFTHASRSEAKLQTTLEQAVSKAAGFDVTLVLRSGDELAEVLAHNPYKTGAPKTLHVFFLPKPPAALPAIDAKAFAPETYKLIGREVYLRAPNGMGTSKLAAALARKLPGATARNVRTVEKLSEMTRRS